jgi:hypothetical protein
MKWEYELLPSDAADSMGFKAVDEKASERKLNQFGKDGWEFVAAQQAAGSQTTLFVFMRHLA